MLSLCDFHLDGEEEEDGEGPERGQISEKQNNKYNVSVRPYSHLLHWQMELSNIESSNPKFKQRPKQ